MKSTRAEEPRMIVIACVPDFEKKKENGYGSQAVLLGLLFSLQNYILIVR